jgi:tetratricopeptide (TPR) repeat protein
MINVAELDERIDRCLAILADNPHSQVFAALAEAYRRRGDFGRAFSVCKSGLKHHPDYGPAYVVLAKLYLHQRMLADALGALARAVELEGPTRVTDVLEAEIHLAIGDIKAVQIVVERLRITDPNNAALPEIVEQLQLLRSTPAAPSDSVAMEQPLEPEAPISQSIRPSIECETWEDWSRLIGASDGVEFTFVSGKDGRTIAQYPGYEAVGPKTESIVQMLQKIAEQLPQDIWGAVEELRIETSAGDVWAKRFGDQVIGFAGSGNLMYGAVRQRGLDLASQVNDTSTSATVSGDPE